MLVHLLSGIVETATRLSVSDDIESGYASPKPSKSVSWASSVTSSTEGSEQQEIVALRLELKETMKENLEYVLIPFYITLCITSLYPAAEA